VHSHARGTLFYTLPVNLHQTSQQHPMRMFPAGSKPTLNKHFVKALFGNRGALNRQERVNIRDRLASPGTAG